MVERAEQRTSLISTRSHIVASEIPGFPSIEVKELSFGKEELNLRNLAENLDGEYERSWSVGWRCSKEDLDLFGQVKLNYIDLDEKRADCPIFYKAATLDYAPDISAFVRDDRVGNSATPPNRAFVHLEEVDDSGNRKTTRTLELNTLQNVFFAAPPAAPELFIPIELDYRGKKDGKLNFVSISPKTGIRINPAIPVGLQQLLMGEIARVKVTANNEKTS